MRPRSPPTDGPIRSFALTSPPSAPDSLVPAILGRSHAALHAAAAADGDSLAPAILGRSHAALHAAASTATLCANPREQ